MPATAPALFARCHTRLFHVPRVQYGLLDLKFPRGLTWAQLFALVGSSLLTLLIEAALHVSILSLWGLVLLIVVPVVATKTLANDRIEGRLPHRWLLAQLVWALVEPRELYGFLQPATEPREISIAMRVRPPRGRLQLSRARRRP